MALTESQLATMTSAVAARITGTILGREASTVSTVEVEIAGAAVVFCNEIAPNAPEAILREAAIRLAGWIYGNRPHVAEHEITDPSGTAIKLRFNNSAATANGFRSSGASALLSRFVERRGGVIGGTTAQVTGAGADPDIGTTVMRAAFADTLPFRDTGFRWIGTANGVELDTGWVQPAAFGLWLPNTVWSRVVAVVLLRSINPGLQGEYVSLAEFGPAEAYQFGDTVGQIRYTPLTFIGRFSWPNDIRAVIGELR